MFLALTSEEIVLNGTGTPWANQRTSLFPQPQPPNGDALLVDSPLRLGIQALGAGLPKTAPQMKSPQTFDLFAPFQCYLGMEPNSSHCALLGTDCTLRPIAEALGTAGGPSL